MKRFILTIVGLILAGVAWFFGSRAAIEKYMKMRDR